MNLYSKDQKENSKEFLENFDKIKWDNSLKEVYTTNVEDKDEQGGNKDG